MKRGLVLEGGAMRGMFTAGIMDVMMEHGITFDGIVGVSAGAAFGVNYKSGQIGRAIRYNERFCNDKRYCSIRNLFRDGMHVLIYTPGAENATEVVFLSVQTKDFFFLWSKIF